MTQQKQNKAANLPAEIVAELERQHLKVNENNRQKLEEIANACGVSFDIVKNCHIEPTDTNGGGFFVWLMKVSEHQAGKPWGVQYDYINNPAKFCQGLQEMTPTEWIASTLSKITPKDWQEGKARPVFKIKKLKDNRPQTLAQEMESASGCRCWFVYIHQDEDARKYYGLKWRAVCGTFDPETKKDQGGRPSHLFNDANKYTNRKHCAAVYMITTPEAPAEEKRRKQTQRAENRPAVNYWRYKNIEAHTSANDGGLLRNESITADQIGGKVSAVVYARRWGICYSSEWHYKNTAEILAEYFDKSGNHIQKQRQEMARRTHQLKTERAEAKAKAHNYENEIQTLKERAARLCALMREMCAEFEKTRAAEDWGDFYFSHLLANVADCVSDCHKIADNCAAKRWCSFDSFAEKYESNKQRAARLAVVVAEWLNLEPGERGKDQPKERALYSGAYNIKGGALIYDFAKLEGRP